MADQKLSSLTELAAAPAVDDELYIRDISEAAAAESKRITVANLIDHTPKAHTIASHSDTTGTGPELDELTDGSETALHSHAAAATKEIFIPAVPFGNGIYDPLGAQVSGGGFGAAMRMLIPADFTSITAISVIFMPRETGANMKLDITTYYAAYTGGEDYNVHTEFANARNIGATTANRYLNHSMSDLVDVAALAAGDFLVVLVGYDATAIDTNVFVQGLRLKYS